MIFIKTHSNLLTKLFIEYIYLLTASCFKVRLWLIFTISVSAVTYEQLKAMLANHSVQLFDVRNPDEFQAGRIPDSVNIPLGQLEESLKLPPQQFQLQFGVKAPEKEDDNIVFHCRSGKRSLTALEIAHRLGFSKARHYAGGYIDWEQCEKK
uniref:Si:ch211-161h7.8 n=1 Tax=Sinocyclocheilus grahami TaxID=75366 RepID=A0A672RQ36_SINGR